MTFVTTHDCTKRPPGWCWRLAVSGICAMIGLAVIDPALGTENGFDGVYIGKRVLTKGSKQMCQTADDVSVTIRGELLTLTNNSATIPWALNLIRTGRFLNSPPVPRGATCPSRAA